MERYFIALLGVLLLASTGAFLLFVPILSIVVVAMVAIGLALMFYLGLQVGHAQPSRAPEVEICRPVDVDFSAMRCTPRQELRMDVAIATLHEHSTGVASRLLH